MTGRRDFLRGLVALPLVGGALSLIGDPTGPAVPVTAKMLDAYDAWLDLERSWLRWERYGSSGFGLAPFAEVEVVFRNRRSGTVYGDFRKVDNPAGAFRHDLPLPSCRAAVVLSAVGVPIQA